MDKPKTQTLKPELFVNESIIFPPTVTLEPAVLIDAIENSELIPKLKKAALCNIVIGLKLDNAIKAVEFLIKAKELLSDDPITYNVVMNITKNIVLIINQ